MIKFDSIVRKFIYYIQDKISVLNKIIIEIKKSLAELF